MFSGFIYFWPASMQLLTWNFAVSQVFVFLHHSLDYYLLSYQVMFKCLVLLRKCEKNSFCVKLKRNRIMQGNQVTCTSFCLCEENLNRKRSSVLASSLYLNQATPQCYAIHFSAGSEASTKVHFASTCIYIFHEVVIFWLKWKQSRRPIFTLLPRN